MTVASPEITEVSIGDRTAKHIAHYDSWRHAVWAANYEATEHKRRCVVLWCAGHKQWTVWRTNQKVRLHQPQLWCQQCGYPYDSPACGPTHAIIASRQAGKQK